MGESAAFVIIAIGMKRIDAEALPHFAVKFVFYGIHAIEFYKYSDRSSGNFPTAYSYAHSFRKFGVECPVGKSGDFAF